MQFALWLALLMGAWSPNGDVAFIDGAGTPNACVSVVNLESEVLSVVGPGLRDGAPQWSPDGEWLAFESDGSEERRSIYVVRADGTDGRFLSHNDPWNVTPRWSTDGTRLVYSSASTPGGLAKITVFDLNGRIEETWGAGGLGLLRPVWMPYNKFLWELDPETPLELDGVDVTRFLSEARMGRLSIVKGVLPEAVLALQVLPGNKENRGLQTKAVLVSRNEIFPFLKVALRKEQDIASVQWQAEPNWEGAKHDPSANTAMTFGAHALLETGEASRIVYESREGGDREIYVLSKRGKANVTNHYAADWNPVWAPDGRRIAFESFRDGQRGIYQVFTDTGLVTPLAVGEHACWSPAWSPDGKAIVYVSDAEGIDGIYLRAEKTDASRRLTGIERAAAAPTWRPEREQ